MPTHCNGRAGRPIWAGSVPGGIRPGSGTIPAQMAVERGAAAMRDGSPILSAVDVEAAQVFFSLLAVLAGAGAIVLLVARFVARSSPAVAQLVAAVDDAALWIAFLVAATCMAGSLYFSEVADFVPCRLCWFQRIAMYPLAVILLVAAIRRDRGRALVRRSARRDRRRHLDVPLPRRVEPVAGGRACAASGRRARRSGSASSASSRWRSWRCAASPPSWCSSSPAAAVHPGALVSQSRSRTPIVIGIVLAVVAVVAIAAVVLTSGGDDDDAGARRDRRTATVTVDGDPLPQGEAPDDPAVGKPVPTIARHRLHRATTVSIAPGEDGPMMIVVMAHWCPHCNEEVPTLVDVGAVGRRARGPAGRRHQHRRARTARDHFPPERVARRRMRLGRGR